MKKKEAYYHSQKLHKYDKRKNIGLHGGVLVYLRIYIFCEKEAAC